MGVLIDRVTNWFWIHQVTNWFWILICWVRLTAFPILASFNPACRFLFYSDSILQDINIHKGKIFLFVYMEYNLKTHLDTSNNIILIKVFAILYHNRKLYSQVVTNKCIHLHIMRNLGHTCTCTYQYTLYLQCTCSWVA